MSNNTANQNGTMNDEGLRRRGGQRQGTDQLGTDPNDVDEMLKRGGTTGDYTQDEGMDEKGNEDGDDQAMQDVAYDNQASLS